MAPRSQPVVHNWYLERIPVTSAAVMGIFRCHGNRGLCSKLLLSPMGLGGVWALKQTLGWSCTTALLSLEDILGSFAWKE